MDRINRIFPNLRRAAGRGAGWYCAVAIGLLVVAAALRFYGLPERYLSFDEAVAANNSGGALSEVIPKTRSDNSSPILYPLVLWAVQKVESSRASVRIVPFAASVLTIAALLFLLPRAGVSRWAVLLAVLLATVSGAAIAHAQGAREYSVDALVAVLLIAGLLWYLRDGRKALLGAALFAAPLLQYGLVLFGVAVLGAAVICLPPRPALPGEKRRSHRERIWHWLKRRINLAGPGACFLVGCAISYAVTLRHQWREEGWFVDGFLREFYYHGAYYDVVGILDFAVLRTWSLLDYHLPPVVALVAVGALALLLLAVAVDFRRNDGMVHRRAIMVLFLLAVAIAIGAAVAQVYPLGGTRHNIYLGPVIFLAAGIAYHSVANSLGALIRRAWRTPALVFVSVSAGVIALAVVVDLWQNRPYRAPDTIDSIFTVLDESAPDGDAVYVHELSVPWLKFYQRDKPDNYHYGRIICWEPADAECIREMFTEALAHSGGSSKVWFISIFGNSALKRAAEGVGQFSIEQVIAGGNPKLYLATTAEARLHRYQSLASGVPVALAVFDVYRDGDKLHYVKAPCRPADTEAPFFLHIIPADVNDLPAPRQQHGFDNLDFGFEWRGKIFDGKCLASVSLPDYAIERIKTGQYTADGEIWQAGFPFAR